MTFHFTDDSERIKEASGEGRPYIVVFSVDDSNKIRRLGEFIERLRILAPFAGRSCFLKPNMVSAERYPTTTDADVLGLVVEKLTACSKIAVGDSPAQGKMDMYKHPVALKSKELGVEFLDLRGTDTRLMDTVPIHTYPLEFDDIISFPILKEHFVCGITFALKNNFGFTDKSVRMRLHMRPKKLDGVIAELHGEYPVSLVIGDACRTMRKAQEKRWGGSEEKLGMFFLSNAPVELDSFAHRLLPHRKVRHLELAREKYAERDTVVWLEELLRREFS